MDGLTGLRRPEDVAELRGLSIREVLGIHKKARGEEAEDDATTREAEAEAPEPRRRRAAAAASADAPRRQREAAARRLRVADVTLKQVRSANGASPAQRDTLRSLRLGRIGSESDAGTTPAARTGMIREVVAPGRGREGLLMARLEPEDVGLHIGHAPSRARASRASASAAARAPASARPPAAATRAQGSRAGCEAQGRLRGRPEPDPHADAQAARPAQEDVDAVRAVPHPHPAGQRRRPRGALRRRRRGHPGDAARPPAWRRASTR